MQLALGEFGVVTHHTLPRYFLHGFSLFPRFNHGFKLRSERFNLGLEQNTPFLHPLVVLCAEAHEPLVVDGRDKVVYLRNTYFDGRKRDVLLDREVVEKIELLEHHPHFSAVFVDVDFQVRKVHSLEENLTAGRVFETVKTSEKSGLAAARRSDDDHFLAFVDRFGNVIQHKQIAELLGEVDDFDYGLLGRFGRVCCRIYVFIDSHNFVICFCHSSPSSFLSVLRPILSGKQSPNRIRRRLSSERDIPTYIDRTQ